MAIKPYFPEADKRRRISALLEDATPAIQSEFEELRSELKSEKVRTKRYEKGIAWLVFGGIALFAYTIYHRSHIDYWSLDPQEPFVVHHEPTMFSEDEFIYKWGVDTQGNEGWLRYDEKGKYTGEDVALFESDGDSND